MSPSNNELQSPFDDDELRGLREALSEGSRRLREEGLAASAEARAEAERLLAVREPRDRKLVVYALVFAAVIAGVSLLDWFANGFRTWMQDHAVVASFMTEGILVLFAAYVVERRLKQQEHRATDPAADRACDEIGTVCAKAAWVVLRLALADNPTGRVQPLVTSFEHPDLVAALEGGIDTTACIPRISSKLAESADHGHKRIAEIATGWSWLPERDDVQRLLVGHAEMARLLASVRDDGRQVLDHSLWEPYRADAWRRAADSVDRMPEIASKLLHGALEARVRSFSRDGGTWTSSADIQGKIVEDLREERSVRRLAARAVAIPVGGSVPPVAP